MLSPEAASKVEGPNCPMRDTPKWEFIRQCLVVRGNAKDSHFTILTNQEYSNLLQEVLEAKVAVKKTHLMYRRLRRFDVTDINGHQQLVAKSANNEIRCFLPINEIYDVLEEVHVTSGHGGRDRIRKRTTKKYANVTRDMINIFLSICEICQTKRKRKAAGVAPFDGNSKETRIESAMLHHDPLVNSCPEVSDLTANIKVESHDGEEVPRIAEGCESSPGHFTENPNSSPSPVDDSLLHNESFLHDSLETSRKRRTPPDNIDDLFACYLRSRPVPRQNTNEMFLLSLKDSMDKLSEDANLVFRIEVMAALRRRLTNRNPPQDADKNGRSSSCQF